MVAPIRYLSRRVQEQKIGILQSTENEKVLEVVGRVGIGTTIFDADYNLDVRGTANVTGILSVGQIISGAGNTFSDLTVTGVSTFQSAARFVDGTEALPSISFINDTDLGLYRPADNEIAFTNGGSESVRITSSGDVGIGTDNPSQKLDVNGNVNIRGELHGPETFIIDPEAVGDNTGAVRIKGDLYVDGENFIIDSETITLADFVVGIASTVPSDTLLDGAGIGIGSLSPGGQHYHTFLYRFNSGNGLLQSSEHLSVANDKCYFIGSTERLCADTLSLGTGTTIHSPTSNVLTFGTNSEERIRIDDQGRVGIGSTQPSQKLDVNGNVAIGGLSLIHI